MVKGNVEYTVSIRVEGIDYDTYLEKQTDIYEYITAIFGGMADKGAIIKDLGVHGNFG